MFSKMALGTEAAGNGKNEAVKFRTMSFFFVGGGNWGSGPWTMERRVPLVCFVPGEDIETAFSAIEKWRLS